VRNCRDTCGPDRHLLRALPDHLVDCINVQVDQLLGIVTPLPRNLNIRGIAQHRERNFIKLDVGTTPRSQIGYFFPQNGRGIMQELFPVGIYLSREHAVARKEVRYRWRWQGGLDRLVCHFLCALEIICSQRLAAFELSGYLWFHDHGDKRTVGEPDWEIAVYRVRAKTFHFVVEKLTPPTLAIFAVRDHMDSGALLHGDCFGNALILNSSQLFPRRRPPFVFSASGHQALWAGQATDVFCTKWSVHDRPQCFDDFTGSLLAHARPFPCTISGMSKERFLASCLCHLARRAGAQFCQAVEHSAQCAPRRRKV
jgi:hypothetical protein